MANGGLEVFSNRTQKEQSLDHSHVDVQTETILDKITL